MADGAAATGTTVDTDGLTASQHARRDRIMKAAIALASKGGYDGVQMRDVADRADVALGTLYRYFPSKVHLLVATLNDQSQALQRGVDRRPPAGDTAADRVLSVLRRATRALEREPQLTEAMLRALMFADTSAAREVDSVNMVTRDLVLQAIGPRDGDRSFEQLAIARVIGQVWQSSLLTWLSGRLSPSDLYDNLGIAVRLLLRDHEDRPA